MPIRGVVFDLDGTLVSQELDFEAIRREIGLPTGTPLLEALRQLDV
jgi:phosphoglycolate phosphatase-like HAD superfamily hydrolase